MELSTQIGLTDSLQKVFGMKAYEILLVAAFFIQEGSVLDSIDDWQDRNCMPGFEGKLYSQSASRLFASTDPAQRLQFFQEWIKSSFNGGSVCYDVTSVSSYSEMITSIERGYNRDGENRAQFNLGLSAMRKPRWHFTMRVITAA